MTLTLEEFRGALVAYRKWLEQKEAWAFATDNKLAFEVFGEAIKKLDSEVLSKLKEGEKK
jgi:hypothetical protein